MQHAHEPPPISAHGMPLLDVRDVAISFGGVTALRGADLAVRRGSITGLIGPNGAGKTTLFHVISGLARAQRGSIRLGGVDITNRSPDRVARAGLARTFQLASLFPRLSVYEHLMLHGSDHPGETLAGLMLSPRAVRRREAALAERAWTVARRLRLDGVADNPATALSGGQKKLLEIGRALMSSPRLILFDEPAAGVNPTLVGEIADHVRALRDGGVTILLIEHDLSLIGALCDHVVVMAEGRRMTEGSFATVCGDKRVQDAYLGRRH